MQLRAQRGRMVAIFLVLGTPAVEACGGLFDPVHGSIAGTWVRRFPNEEYWNIDPPPPDLQPTPPRIWTVEGTRDGSKVSLTFDDGGAVQQYFEGKHTDLNLIEGFVAREQGSELQTLVEFVRQPDGRSTGAPTRRSVSWQ